MPEAIAVIKLRLNPDAETARILDGQSKKCNWLYNQLLEKANALRVSYREQPSEEISKVLYTSRGLRNLVPGFKEENPFLKTVHSSPLKNAALRLTDCIQSYQKSRKGQRKGKTGWPKFRSWKAQWFSLFYDEPNKGFCIEGSILRLSLGSGLDRKDRALQIALPEASALKGKSVRNLRIVKQAGVFSTVMTVVRQMPEQKQIKRVIAFDPNHKNFAYGVDNEGKAIEIEKPWWVKRYDQRIDEIKSLRDKKQKKSRLIPILDDQGNPTGKQRFDASRQYKKLQTTLERALSKRREQVKVFLFTLANSLYRQYDLVGVGDYTPNGGGITTPMRRAMNNQSLIGQFKIIAKWSAEKSGKHFMEFDESGTTRTCNVCHDVVQEGLSPSIRTWICAGCNTWHIRDENAALNGITRILREVQERNPKQFGLVPSSGPVSVKERWAWRVRPSGVLRTSRGMGGFVKSNRQEIKRRAWKPSIQADQVCA